MRRLNAVVLLLVFSLHCIGAFKEQGDIDSEGRTVSLAFETRYVIVAEHCVTSFSFTLIFECSYGCES